MSTRWVAGLILLGTLALGLYGIHRSLWLDEAWVANSVRAASLGGMFRGGEWLQTSPPLFLLAARASVVLFGLSTAAFRAVPLLFALIAVTALFLAVRRASNESWAVLAAAALGFLSTAIEYFRSFKQYGGEVAAVAVVLFAAVTYLQSPKYYRWLVAAVAVAIPLAYPMAFVVPGLVLAVWGAGGFRRAAILAALAAAEFALLYWFFITPNVSPALWTYWQASLERAYGATAWAAMLFGLAVAVHLALRLLRGEHGAREWIQIVCLLPCILLVAAELTGWYPASARTRLFLRPCLLLLAAVTFDGVLARWPRVQSVLARALPVAAVALVLGGVYTQFRAHADDPFEDYAGAVDYLRAHVQPNDLLLVHASARQGFQLYAAIDGWDAPAVYGETGWPCCRRTANAPPHSATPQAVYHDLAAKVPDGFRGRVWLVYSTRPEHWNYVGLDEATLWRSHLWARGCPPGPYIELPNLGISPMDCAPAHSFAPANSP